MFIGSYDHNVYAVDVRTGEEAWRFTAGAPVFAAPALGHIRGKPALFAPAADRTVYALDAATGEKIWSHETREWTFTSIPSVMTSPTVVEAGDETLVYVGVWNADRSAVGNVQKGELYCFGADDGKVKWNKTFGATPATCPAVAPIDGRPGKSAERRLRRAVGVLEARPHDRRRGVLPVAQGGGLDRVA